MKTPLAGAIAIALALVPSIPAAGQAGPDPRALEEKVRALEARQAESEKALEALKASLAAASPSSSTEDVKKRLEALEREQAATKAALEAIRVATLRKEPGPIEPTGLVPKSIPLFGSSRSSAPPARSLPAPPSTLRSRSSPTSSTRATT